LGHELMEVEEAMDGDYTAATEEFEAAGAPLREYIAAYEEVAARVSLVRKRGDEGVCVSSLFFCTSSCTVDSLFGLFEKAPQTTIQLSFYS